MAKARTIAKRRRHPPHIDVAGFVGVWFERVRARRESHGLDNQILQDIGIARLDVQREIDKPFWRP